MVTSDGKVLFMYLIFSRYISDDLDFVHEIVACLSLHFVMGESHELDKIGWRTALTVWEEEVRMELTPPRSTMTISLQSYSLDERPCGYFARRIFPEAPTGVPFRLAVLTEVDIIHVGVVSLSLHR